MISVRDLQGIDDILQDMQRLEGQLPKRSLDEFPLRTSEEIENEDGTKETKEISPAKEQVKIQYALKLGINLCSTTDQEPDFDEDKERAFLYIMRGQKVPEELERKLIQREQDRISRERQKQKENEA